MDEIIIIIDTSVLRKHSSLNTPEFELLAELSRIKAVKFKLPEMVDKEYFSQKTAEIEKHYNRILTSLKNLQTKDHKNNIQFTDEIEKFQAAKKLATLELEKEWKKYKRKKNISVIPFSTTSTNRVFKDYFKGNPPYKNVKNRNDIPDSFILHSILNFTNKENLHFVCADEALRKSVSSSNIKVYESISELLEIPIIKSKSKELENLTSVNIEFELVKSNEATLSIWITKYLNSNIPFELYNSTGLQSKHKDKLVKIFEINSINFDFDKTRLFNSQFLIIPTSIEASIEIEMVYTQEEYLKRSKPLPL
jgi:hypothetical protein